MIYTYEWDLEGQNKNNPRSIDVSRSFFIALLSRVTHQAIELIYRELIGVKQERLDVEEEGLFQAAIGNKCQNACHRPKRYSLPCKYWLYRCVVSDIPIPLSLIHPRWLFEAPEIVVGWEMACDPSITPAHCASMLGTDNARSQSNGQSSDDDDGAPGPVPALWRYARRGLDMLKAEAISAYDFHKKIPEAHRAEEYTREIMKAIQGVNRAYDQKYDGSALPQSFAVAKKNDENLTFKKNESRRRALTGREAADAEDLAKRRRIPANELEIARKEKHAEQIQIDAQPSPPFHRKSGLSKT